MAQASSRRNSGGGPDAQTIAATAAEIGVPLTSSQGEALARYAVLLERWNVVHNLTAIAAADSITHHLADSFAILPTIDAIVGENRANILDVGSGGGLPGIPIAVARPAFHLTLIDKVQKKAAFLTQAIVELALANAEAIHGRVESVGLPPFFVVMSRAFASLEQFVRLTRHLVEPAGWWVAMKGALPRAELDVLRNAHPDVRVVDAIKLHVPRLGAERHLILLQRP